VFIAIRLCRAEKQEEKAKSSIYSNTISLHCRHKQEYNSIRVRDMDSQSGGVGSMEVAIVVAFLAVAVGFVIFMQSGGFLQFAIDRAIEDERVILGMTKDDVVSSWGWSYHSEEQSIKIMGVDETVALTWTYEGRGQAVHFNSDGIVIWVAKCSGD
jgi:hypothetical protein